MMTINQSFYHSETLLSSFQHTPNNFRCLFRRVRSYDKKDITRLFSYRHLYQVLGRQQPSTSPRTVIDADTPLFLTDRSTLSTLTASAEWFIYLLTYLPILTAGPSSLEDMRTCVLGCWLHAPLNIGNRSCTCDNYSEESLYVPCFFVGRLNAGN